MSGLKVHTREANGHLEKENSVKGKTYHVGPMERMGSLVVSWKVRRQNQGTLQKAQEEKETGKKQKRP